MNTRAVPLVLTLFLILFASISCSTVDYDRDIPITEQHFKQAPEELLNFPVFKDKKNALKTIKAKSLKKHWGLEQSSSKDYGGWAAYLGFMGGLVGLVLPGQELAGFAFGAGFGFLIQPKPLETDTWEKGDYRVDATFFGYDNRLVNWQWRHKDSADPIFPKTLPKTKVVFNTEISSSRGFGYDTRNANQYGSDGEIDYTVGVRIDNVLRNTDVRVSVPLLFTSSNLEKADNRYEWQNFYVSTALVYDANSRINYGAGIKYYLDSEIRRYDETGKLLSRTDVDDDVGVFMQIEYESKSPMAYGLRLEYQEQDLPQSGKFSRSSVGVYWAIH